ncbi:hypothetical protein K458DRAFT_102146 [Lentithecium fluviatile CBS 122367]|uniref:Uncharacterized protein n=1 Tax=Lentithecium fluviatile CBS 122367 TaxID=1168545 RepID=A0A6G1JJJ8_9PLEO|nr:hypothetical protein K458DRAFT_102146 [Lentithecium fluviatile CBS 122367]
MFAPRIIMAHSPPQDPWSPYLQSSPESPLADPPQFEVPSRPKSSAPPPTQYEFITQTGDESAATTKQKLKTVRSHVMKNYLHQHQQQNRQTKGSSSSALATSAERRKGKQRARSSRSASRDTESPTSPTMSEGMRGRSASASNDFGPTASGFVLPMPFSGSGCSSQADFGKPRPPTRTLQAHEQELTHLT